MDICQILAGFAGQASQKPAIFKNMHKETNNYKLLTYDINAT